MVDDSLRVRDVMTKDVVTLQRNDRLLVADDLMRLGRIRHLPVVDETGALAGIVTQRDLFHSGLQNALGYGSHTQRPAQDMVVVKTAMKTNVVTTTPDTLLKEAAKLMLARDIGCLVVVDEGRIAGILTEADFVKLLARPHHEP